MSIIFFHTSQLLITSYLTIVLNFQNWVWACFHKIAVQMDVFVFGIYSSCPFLHFCIWWCCWHTFYSIYMLTEQRYWYVDFSLLTFKFLPLIYSQCTFFLACVPCLRIIAFSTSIFFSKSWRYHEKLFYLIHFDLKSDFLLFISA